MIARSAGLKRLGTFDEAVHYYRDSRSTAQLLEFRALQWVVQGNLGNLKEKGFQNFLWAPQWVVQNNLGSPEGKVFQIVLL